MACDGDPLPTFNSCDASLTLCAVTLSASINVPCGADSYTLHVYRKKDSAPTGIPAEQIASEVITTGPATHIYSGADAIDEEGCGTWHYLFRIECTGVGTYGTCTDTVTKTTTVTFDSFNAEFDGESCVVHLNAVIDIPCNVDAGEAKVYGRLGATPTLSAEYLLDTQAIPAGVVANHAVSFADHDVSGQPGTWHYIVEVATGLGCSSIQSTEETEDVPNDPPTIDSCGATPTDCNIALVAEVTIPCASTDYHLKVYKKKGSSPSGIEEEEIDDVALPAGPDGYSYSNSDDVTGEGCGDFYYLFRIEKAESTYGTCEDTANVSNTVSFDALDAEFDGESCVVHLNATIDIPCNVGAGGVVNIYKALGATPTIEAGNLHDTQPLPAGPLADTNIEFADHDVSGAPGTWHYLCEAVPGQGCSSVQSPEDTAVVPDDPPSLVSCNAELTGCAVALTASVTIPCASTDYHLVVYRKMGSAPTGLESEEIDDVPLPSGPSAYSYDGSDDISNEGCGTWHYLFRIEKESNTFGTCEDSVGTSDSYTIDSLDAQLDSETCMINLSAQVDIPCNLPIGSASLYRRLGSAPTPSAEYLHQTVPVPAGPLTNETLNFDALDVRCQPAGTYHFLLELTPGAGCSSIQITTTAAIGNGIPVLSDVDVNVDKCDWILNAKVTYGCDVEENRYQVRAYYRYAVAVPAVPPAQSRIPGVFDVPCGPGANVIQWRGTVKADGKHFWKVCLFDRGVVIQSVQVTRTINGCNEDIDIFPFGLSVPHEGIDEMIYLVKVARTGEQSYEFTDQRILRDYQLITWNYHRKGGCGSFRLLLRESFHEAPTALDEGWEVHVRIRLPDEDAYTTWYRGVIRTIKRQYEANEVLTEVAGQGYLEQLANVQVDRRYPKGITVADIVQDILTSYVLPNTRIIQTATPRAGIDVSSYVTQGPLHFVGSALKAIKFLSEIQGDREFGVSSDRKFYFREKKTIIEDSLFETKDIVEVVEGGKEVQKVNKLNLGGKMWGHEQSEMVFRDMTDISNFGLFERPVDVPHVEHRGDAHRWSENIVNLKKGASLWRTVAWTQLDRRIERNHPTEAVGQIRIYGKDISREITDLDIQKIVYSKGGFQGKGEIREIHDPKSQPMIDQPVLRAVIHCGFHHHDLVEELEEKVYDPIASFKTVLRQYQNPRVDVTNPKWNDINTVPGQLWAQPVNADVTHHGPYRLRMRDDLTNWPDLVKMSAGDHTTPPTGAIPGEEFFVWSNAARNQGTKYYWDGVIWRSMSGGGGGGSGSVVFYGSTPSTITPNALGTPGVIAEAAKGDHEHPMPTGAALDITNANAEGTGSAFARAGHRHRGVLSLRVKDGAEIVGSIDITTNRGLRASQLDKTITIHGISPGSARDITNQNIDGVGDEYARAGHQHRGILSARVKGQPEIVGHIDITTEGSISARQSGNTIILKGEASGGGGSPTPGVPVDITNLNDQGAAVTYALSDHHHKGILTVKVKGQADIFGYVDITTEGVLKARQSGQTIILGVSGSSEGSEETVEVVTNAYQKIHTAAGYNNPDSDFSTSSLVGVKIVASSPGAQPAVTFTLDEEAEVMIGVVGTLNYVPGGDYRTDGQLGAIVTVNGIDTYYFFGGVADSDGLGQAMNHPGSMVKGVVLPAGTHTVTAALRRSGSAPAAYVRLRFNQQVHVTVSYVVKETEEITTSSGGFGLGTQQSEYSGQASSVANAAVQNFDINPSTGENIVRRGIGLRVTLAPTVPGRYLLQLYENSARTRLIRSIDIDTTIDGVSYIPFSFIADNTDGTLYAKITNLAGSTSTIGVTIDIAVIAASGTLTMQPVAPSLGVDPGMYFTDVTNQEGLRAKAGDGVTVTSAGINVDSTVVRTSGDQTIAGIKKFSAQVGQTPAATSGAPTSGTHALGEIHNDSNNNLWRCTAAGSPGTWVWHGHRFQSNVEADFGVLATDVDIATYARRGIISRMRVWSEDEVPMVLLETDVPFHIEIYSKETRLSKDLIWSGQCLFRKVRCTTSPPVGGLTSFDVTNIGSFMEGDIIRLFDISNYEFQRISEIVVSTKKFNTYDEILNNYVHPQTSVYYVNQFFAIPWFNDTLTSADQFKLFLRVWARAGAGGRYRALLDIENFGGQQ